MADTPQTDTTQSIPEHVKHIFALRGKNVGCSVKLRGRVVLVAFLINDGESKWDSASERVAAESLKNITQKLMNDSGLGRQDLDIAYAFCQVTVPYVVSRRNSSQLPRDVLRQFGHQTVEGYQRHYEKKFARDEACVSFVFNKKFRSYAHNITSNGDTDQQEIPVGEEYSMVSFEPENPKGSERTFIHELLHQFGAIDYYYPERLKLEAECHFPGSIMNSGSEIDPLTRYLIGWDDTLSDKAIAFLEAISVISEAEIKCANRDEWLRG